MLSLTTDLSRKVRSRLTGAAERCARSAARFARAAVHTAAQRCVPVDSTADSEASLARQVAAIIAHRRQLDATRATVAIGKVTCHAGRQSERPAAVLRTLEVRRRRLAVPTLAVPTARKKWSSF